MGLSYTFNGHAIARAANDLSLHTDVVRSVLDAYLAEELRAAGVTEHTTSVTFSDRADALFAVPKKPSDIEVIAKRLAKVEDRLARLVLPIDNYGSILTRLDAQEARHDDLWKRVNKMQTDTHARITKVADIIGERVSGLVDDFKNLTEIVENMRTTKADWVDDLAAVRDIAVRAHERLDSDLPQISAALEEIRRLTLTPAVPFPTGGAHTAEAAAEAVLPVPQRGDRVRLDRVMLGQYRVPDGWHTVTGAHEGTFQICIREAKEIGDLPSWHAYFDNSLIQELHHADHT